MQFRDATRDTSESTDSRAPSIRARLGLAVAGAVLSGIRAAMWTVGEGKPRDFDQIWYAVHAVAHGRNPYAEIGPGLAFEWFNPFFYPLTAPISVFPFAILPRSVAAVLFAAMASGLFVWAATRRSLAPAVVITSASAALAAEAVQWSPLLAAAMGLPWLGFFLAAKPTIGLAVFFARPTRAALLGVLAVTLVSLVFQPSWPVEWLHALRATSLATPGGTPYSAPVLTPGGALAVVALARWRRPEARLVAALACVPQTTLLYETVPLFLVPLTITEGGILWLGSWVAALWISLLGPYPSDAARFATAATAMGWLLYLPSAIMILRRPNEGELPDVVEQTMRRRVPGR
jgi:hypothetical protein